MKTKLASITWASLVAATALFVLGSVFFVIWLQGYTLVFFNIPAISFAALIIAGMIFLTLGGILCKNKQTKTSLMACVLLPLFAIFFITTLRNAATLHRQLYTALSFVVLLCSMTLFFARVRHIVAKITLGCLYSVAAIPVVFALFATLILPPFGHNEIVQTRYSPNAVHRAEIVANSQGALGGATWIEVTNLDKNISLLIGELRTAPHRIYSGRWGEFHTMTLRWETDEILHIRFENAEDNTVTFVRGNNRWHRR